MLDNLDEFQLTGLKWEQAETELREREISVEEIVELRPPSPGESLGGLRLVLTKPGKRGIIAFVTYENYRSKDRQPRSLAGFYFLEHNG